MGGLLAGIDKLIERLQRRPPEADFNDLRRVLEYFGWSESTSRGKGSHVTDHSPDRRQRVTVPLVHGRRVKREYVDEVLEALGLAEE